MGEFGADYFKGYITFGGRHVRDGLKERPISFQEIGNDLVLRWVHPTGLRSPSFEVETRISKQNALNGNFHFNAMNVGIVALEGLKNWVEENGGKII